MDITPSWQGILPLLLEHYANPQTRETACDELHRMAMAADMFIRSRKNNGLFEPIGDAAARVVDKLSRGQL
jgi:hypothetical protein